MEGIVGLSQAQELSGGKKFLTNLKQFLWYLHHLSDEVKSFAFSVVDSSGERIESRSIENSSHLSKILDSSFVFPPRSPLEGIGCLSGVDQPELFVQDSHLGPFSVAFSGLIRNEDFLAGELKFQGAIFEHNCSDAEIVGAIIAREKSFVNGLKKAMEIIEGDFVVLILTPTRIYATRDLSGGWELLLGRSKEDQTLVLSMDNCAFESLGFETVRGLRPGEICFLAGGNFGTLHLKEGKEKVCSFLPIYTRFPSGSFYGKPVDVIREEAGAFLAREDIKKGLQFDLVTCVPDSGRSAFLGYCNEWFNLARMKEEKFPQFPRLTELQFKYGYGGMAKSFTPLGPQERELRSIIKLLSSSRDIRGKRIVLIDDSIVRGRQLRRILVLLAEAGVIAVHFRISFPMIFHPCTKGKITKRGELLTTRYRTEEKINGWLRQAVPGVETDVSFNEVPCLVRAIGLPEEQLCLDCVKK